MASVRSNSPETDPCPICIDKPKFAAETNCGHMFCGICILEVWRTGPKMSPISCPSCRQDVTVLLFCFTISEVEGVGPEQQEVKDRVMREIKCYNRIFSRHPKSKPNEVVQPLVNSSFSNEVAVPRVRRMQSQRQQQQQLNSNSGIATGAAVVVGVGAVLVAGVLASLGVGVLRLAIGSARNRD